MTNLLNKLDVELPMRLLDWIDKDKDKLNWHVLSTNSNAIKMLKENPLYIDWDALSENTSYQAIKLLKDNPLKINWTRLSNNPSAAQLLTENPLNEEYFKVNFSYKNIE